MYLFSLFVKEKTLLPYDVNNIFTLMGKEVIIQ